MRLTPLRQAMLAVLAAHRTPVSLEILAQADGVRGRCDATTIYRTLMLFKAAAIVRQVSAPTKTSLFLLNMPGESYQFLVCQHCGSIKEVALSNETLQMLRNAAAAEGFIVPTPDCELYGLCPACATADRHRIPPSKLLSRREGFRVKRET
jgi:Fur family zinc uptake transcriptional regulator